MKYLIRRGLSGLTAIILLFSLLASSLTYSQRRPTLRMMRRDYFAGKVLVIPHDYRQSSVQQPNSIAQIADHDLIIPAERLLDDPEKLNTWVKSLDFDEVDGAIISLETLAGNPDSDRARERLKLIRELRAQRRAIPIYAITAFGKTAEAASPIIQSAVEMIADGSIDFLLVNGGKPEKPDKLDKLKEVIAARRLGGRVAFGDHQSAVVVTLLTRMLNQRFGFVPKIFPVLSSKSAGSQMISQMASAEIKKIDGIELTPAATGQRAVETLLFIQNPQTSESERAAFVDAIAQTITRNVRVAVVDLSETKESKEALVAELRRRKLVDQLASYASSDLMEQSDQASRSEALTRALAQASSFLVSIRFLRDDLERVRRLDRAQSSLTLSSLLNDWAFPLRVRPKLQIFLSAQGVERLDQNTAEIFALNEIKLIATELYNEQFLRNVHAILLSNGERAQFENRLLQRVQLRLESDWRRRPEAEIKAAVYLVHLGNQPSPQSQQQSMWELSTDRLDDSIGRRWGSIEWQNFKTDVGNVEMSVKIINSPAKPAQPANIANPANFESYSIVSKRSRSMRRIEITAPSNQGAFYALSRLEQLGVEGQLAQDFQLNEAPALARRGVVESPKGYWSHGDRLEMIRVLGRLRMNRFYSSAGGAWQSPLTERGGEKFRELLRVADENFVQFFYLIAPEASGSEQELSTIEQRLKLLAALGVKNFAVASAPADLVNRLRERLKTVHSDVALVAWPPSSDRPPIVCLDPQTALSALKSNPIDDALGLVVSPAVQRNASIVGLAVVAEYAWDVRRFDAPRAFNLAFNTLFDERSRAGLRVWAATSGVCRSDGKNDSAELEAGLSKQKVAELQAALELITGTRERGLLRGELAKILARP